MSKITIEELPSSAQEACRKKAKNRKALLFAEWAIAAVGFVFILILCIQDGKPLSGIVGGLFFGLVFGGWVCGLDHLGYLFKKVVKNGIGLIIILGLWYIAVFAAIAMLASLVGWVFLIIDSICFFAKKPLIFQSEINRILQSEQVQTELLYQAIGEASEPSTADKLQELKDMLDSGLITEAEFNGKKEELLKNI